MSHMANCSILFAMITMSIESSGGCLNPAIGLVQSYYQTIIVNHYKSLGEFKDITILLKTVWIYIVAPSLGGIVAGFIQIGIARAGTMVLADEKK